MLILSPGVLERPWCILEIITAQRHGINIIPVIVVQGFKFPDEDCYAALFNGDLYAPDTYAFLEEQGVELEELEAAIRWVFDKICVNFNAQRASGVRVAEIGGIVERCVWPNIGRKGFAISVEKKDSTERSMKVDSTASGPKPMVECSPDHALMSFVTQSDGVTCAVCQTVAKEGALMKSCPLCSINLCERCAAGRGGALEKDVGSAEPLAKSKISKQASKLSKQASKLSKGSRHPEVSIKVAKPTTVGRIQPVDQEDDLSSEDGLEFEEGPASVGIFGMMCCKPASTSSKDLAIVPMDTV